MAAVIIYDEQATTADSARAGGDELWLSASELTAATRWEIKPEGVCREELCIPVPEGAAMLREEQGENWLDLAAFARYIGQSVAHEDTHGVWYFGRPVDERRDQLSMEAPDFELPDLAGTRYRLSAFRGQKLFLLLWASW